MGPAGRYDHRAALANAPGQPPRVTIRASLAHHDVKQRAAPCGPCPRPAPRSWCRARCLWPAGSPAPEAQRPPPPRPLGLLSRRRRNRGAHSRPGLAAHSGRGQAIPAGAPAADLTNLPASTMGTSLDVLSHSLLTSQISAASCDNDSRTARARALSVGEAGWRRVMMASNARPAAAERQAAPRWRP